MKYYLLVVELFLLNPGCILAKSEECGLQHSMAGMAQDGAACMAYMPTWTYDSSKNACIEFIYGGCGGNKNQFGSKIECEQSCKD
ncbi:male accessory gland serine protease inhibitor [Scaptodrosophila lebanonensis]|uniref:Male accessory gland serine protease inhibitor n=1 Tax=Drosophila lebanonensis TaxID=7225 RepID=A0A6J2U9L5_DROLE|nr:male accessory gland serine protease inhibitor [Scaptodrosophila lebanonensis]